MRRTHVMHDRDNRRPPTYSRHDHHDDRPAIEWRRGFPCDVLLLDGRELASVESDGDGFRAEVHASDGFLKANSFTEWDRARLFCESELRPRCLQP